MTNQEAIKVLREKVFPCLITGEWTEAIGMAISALEAQDAHDTNVGTSKYTVSATAVEEMLKDLLPERGMWEIEGDEAKNAVCETVHDALEGLWKLPFAQQEIIYCSDCNNWDKTWTNNFLPNHHYCPMVDGVRKDNFYCADAERREE